MNELNTQVLTQDENNTPNGLISFETQKKEDKLKHLIKVIGVGGAGGNAVKNMYQRGVRNVDFVVCNTDLQALQNNPVPTKVEIGITGAGGVASVGRDEAEKHIDKIEAMLEGDAEMVFIAAGMGGGTGTGAAPVIARKAKERGLLTVAVVTLPFLFEKGKRIKQALLGVEQLKKAVDAMLIVNNQRLLDIYSKESIAVEDAFANADDTLFVATKSIAEIITVEGIINRDFRDVSTVLKDSGSALMASGLGEGENRIQKAIKNALDSPLLNSLDIRKASRMLYIIYTCKDSPVTAAELSINSEFMEEMEEDIEVLFGLYRDDTLGNKVKVTIVATGYDDIDAPLPKEDEHTILEKAQYKELRSKYYEQKSPAEELAEKSASDSAEQDSKPDEVVEDQQGDVSNPDEGDATAEATESVPTAAPEDVAPAPAPNYPSTLNDGGNIYTVNTTPTETAEQSRQPKKSWFETWTEKLMDMLDER